MLNETDLVIRAVIGKVEGHLSEDGRDVHTTYELTNARIAFSSTQEASRLPGMATPVLILTQHGGTVRMGEFAATVQYDDTARLTPGMEVIALLRDQSGKHVLAGEVGIFQVRDSRVVPLVLRHGEHQTFAGMNADAFEREIVSRRRTRK